MEVPAVNKCTSHDHHAVHGFELSQTSVGGNGMMQLSACKATSVGLFCTHLLNQ
jgi:hypothetical protein